MLPEHFADDEERLKRFEREAKTLASLNHPNVAQIFGVDQVGDTCFLVLELVPGESLEERLKRGPLSIDETLDVCKQIAEGLEAAHEAGVIHRDLKPANVRLTPDGKVKVLDFGLAKPANEGNKGSSTDSVLSTEAGRLLGTPTYMAPEQARGRPIDKRVDIWAFGCVLYECLTAKRAFAGDTLSDVLAAVIEREPDWTTLPAATPSRLRELLQRCFAKDPRTRLRDIGDVRIVLAGGAAESARRAGVPPVLAGTVVLLACAGTWLALRANAPQEPPARLRQLEIPDAGFWGGSATAIAPDGRCLVYSAPSQSAMSAPPRVRALERFDSRELASTIARGLNPGFSPDGTQLACFTEQGLFAVQLDSGTTRLLSRSEDWGECSWSSRGGVVFSRAHIGESTCQGLAWVDQSGGTAREITTLQPGELRHTWPLVLPDGQSVLFTVVHAQTSSIALGSTAGGAHRILLQGAGRPRYSPTGHLLYGDSRGRLLAVRFDAQHARMQGQPVVLAEDLYALPESGWAFDISNEGTLIYTSGHGGDTLARQVVLLDREGHSTPLVSETDFWAEPHLSPDGQWVALRRVAIPDCSLWVFDRRRNLLTRVPIEGDPHGISWTPDGKCLVFRLDHRGRPRICKIAVDGSGGVQELSHAEVDYKSAVPLPDGTGYVCTVQGKGADNDLVLLDGASGEARVLLSTPANEGGGSVSPDSRWLSYASDESGRNEVYLRSYPDLGHRLQVSSAGGVRARWSRDGRQLFYASSERLMSVTVGTGPALEVSAPTPVFPDSLQLGPRMEFDPAPDNLGFVAIVGEPQRRAGSLRVVLDWPCLLEGAGIR